MTSEELAAIKTDLAEYREEVGCHTNAAELIEQLIAEVERLQASQADLAMLVKRLIHNNVSGETKSDALGYLLRNKLEGSIMRKTKIEKEMDTQ